MKASKYCHFRPLDEGRVAAFNARTGSYLVITEKCRNALQSLQFVPESVSLAERMILSEFGFLLDDSEDELRMIRTQLFISRYQDRSIGMTIAPTMACNLACTYCYEAGYGATQSMSKDVEEAVIDYIKHELIRPRPVAINWYGGEPLVASDQVIRMSKVLKGMAEEAGARYSASIVTNGTLLNQFLTTQLADLNIRSMQITLDGPKEVHDVRRKYRTGTASSFDAIINNLRTIDFGPIQVVIRCNVDKTNSTAWKELLQQLHDLGFHKSDKFAVYPGLVMPWGGFCSDVSDCLTEKEFVPIKWEFEAFAKGLGFRGGHRPAPKGHYCGADTAYLFTVGPDGSEYKCWNHIGDRSRVVGNILLNLPNPSPCLDWCNYDPTKDEQCRDCDILPICLGGCPEKASYRERRACDLWRLEIEQNLQDWAREWHKEVGSRARLDSVSS